MSRLSPCSTRKSRGTEPNHTKDEGIRHASPHSRSFTINSSLDKCRSSRTLYCNTRTDELLYLVSVYSHLHAFISHPPHTIARKHAHDISSLLISLIVIQPSGAGSFAPICLLPTEPKRREFPPHLLSSSQRPVAAYIHPSIIRPSPCSIIPYKFNSKQTEKNPPKNLHLKEEKRRESLKCFESCAV